MNNDNYQSGMIRLSSRLHARQFLDRLAQASRKNNIRGLLDDYLGCPNQMIYKLINSGCHEKDVYFSPDHLAAQYTFFYLDAIYMTEEAQRNVVCQSNALSVLPDRILSSLNHLKKNGARFNLDEAFIHTIKLCAAIKTREDLTNLSLWKSIGKIGSHKHNIGISFQVFNSPFSSEVEVYAVDMQKSIIYLNTDNQWSPLQTESISEEFIAVLKSNYYRAQYECKMASIDGYNYAENRPKFKGNIYLTKKQKFHAQYA